MIERMYTNENIPQRHSPRLQGYDYAQDGAYFVTICTHGKVHWFGKVNDGEMHLSPAGEIAYRRWMALPDHHPNIELDAFVVMPNHVHGIVSIVGTTPASSAERKDRTGQALSLRPSTMLGTVIGSYKSGVTRRIRVNEDDASIRVWQERYYDHIIRNEADLNRVREYILYNPSRWADDKFYS